MKVWRRPTPKRWGWKDLGRLGITAAVGAYKGYKGYQDIRNTFSKKQVETRPITDQRDVVTTYRKKYMPRRKKRRYLKSLRRWKSTQMRLSPSRIFQYVNTSEIVSDNGYSRYFGAFMGLHAQNVYDNNLGEAWTSISDGSGADLKCQAGKFRLDHQSIRIVLRNRTTADYTTASDIVDVDVYKVICIRDIPDDLWISGDGIESFMATQKNLLRRANGMDVEVEDGGTGIATLQQNAGTGSATQAVGDSLWNNPVFLRYFKVVKQFKVQLGTNNVTEFSWRDSKNHTVNFQDSYASTSGFAAKKGVTKGYIFNINGRAYKDAESVWKFNSATIWMEQYVRYNIKVVPGMSPTLVYDGI